MPDDAAKTTDATARSADGAQARSAGGAPARSAADSKLPSADAAKGQTVAAPASAAATGRAKAAPLPAAPSTFIGPVKPAPAKPVAAAAATAAPARADGAAAAAGPTTALATGRTEPTLPDAPKSGATKTAATPVEGTLIGSLDADERIRAAGQQGERTLWTGAIVATLVYAALIGGQMAGGFASPASMEEQVKERFGQDATSISVELVPDPDKTSKTKRWQEGAEQQTPTPNEQPPQPDQMASLEQPEVPEIEKEPTEEAQDKPEKAKETEEKTEDEPRAEDAPMLLDIDSLVDAAAADFKRNLDHALAKKPQKKSREQQAAVSGGGMQVRGTGASGKSDEFSRSVIAALMKTRPGPFALWGRVLVSFELSPSGSLNYVHVLRSSGNDALDQAAVNAIHKARFKAPPPGRSAQDRTYIIDYIFG